MTEFPNTQLYLNIHESINCKDSFILVELLYGGRMFPKTGEDNALTS